MAAITEPLREEHRELVPSLARIREAADAVGEPTARLRERLDEVRDFLFAHLIPHAKAEEAALYPVVQRLLGSPGATSTMSRDHAEVVRFAREIARLAGGLDAGPGAARQLNELRRLLYGLHAVVSLHFAKEEEVYLPLLDEQLGEEEARAMFAAMEAAAARARTAG